MLITAALLAAFSASSRAHAQESKSAWGFSATNLDKSCKPCENFYEYAMGGWMKSNPIPPEFPSWSTFSSLVDKNQEHLRGILENAEKSGAAKGSNEQKIGDFYASCMDTSQIDGAGLKPIQAELGAIEAIHDSKSLMAEIAALHKEGIRVAFHFTSEQDFKDSTQTIGDLEQSGLGLPDRDYYTREDEKSKQLRADYLVHVAKMFELAGESQEKAGSDANTVMALETDLAKASITTVQRRNPDNIYHKMTTSELQELTPDISWSGYFDAMGVPGLKGSNVDEPDFLKEVNRMLAATPLPDWKTYLKWHLLHAYAPALPDTFVQENFHFYGEKLSGTKEIQPRWKRCTQAVDRNIGEALGQEYVKEYFPPAAKAEMLEMIHNLLAALRADIPTLDWMSEPTKKAALAKLEKLHIKVGYPDKWRDYSKLSIGRASFAGNLRRSAEFETARKLAKIGKPLDRNEWGMTPPTVNAYYNPLMNEIVFPAGILQPPFFDPKADAAINYGGIGAVIGHEVTHGFDDQGSKFDANGNRTDWWTAEDRKNFEARATCVEKQLDGYEVEPGLHQNGKLVLGESIADLGGMTIAYDAYERSLEGKPRPKNIDGFTPEQRFFLGWAQVWGANLRPEYARLLTRSNPHPLPKFRANGPLSNFAPFAKAFGCSHGDPMVRGDVCKIW